MDDSLATISGVTQTSFRNLGHRSRLSASCFQRGDVESTEEGPSKGPWQNRWQRRRAYYNLVTTVCMHGLCYSSEVASVIRTIQTYGTTITPTKSVIKKIVGAVLLLLESRQENYLCHRCYRLKWLIVVTTVHNK